MNGNEDRRLEATASFAPVEGSPSHVPFDVLQMNQETPYQPNGGPIEANESIDFRIYDMWDRTELPPSPQYYHSMLSYSESTAEESDKPTGEPRTLLELGNANGGIGIRHESPAGPLPGVICGESQSSSGVRDATWPDARCGEFGPQHGPSENAITGSRCGEVNCDSELLAMQQGIEDPGEQSAVGYDKIPPTDELLQSSSTAVSTGGLNGELNTASSNTEWIPPVHFTGSEATAGDWVREQCPPPLSSTSHPQAAPNNAPTESQARAPLPRRRTRLHYQDWQISILTREFEKNRRPHKSVYIRLAEILRVPLKCVRIWFKNRRADKNWPQQN